MFTSFLITTGERGSTRKKTSVFRTCRRSRRDRREERSDELERPRVRLSRNGYYSGMIYGFEWRVTVYLMRKKKRLIVDCNSMIERKRSVVFWDVCVAADGKGSEHGNRLQLFNYRRALAVYIWFVAAWDSLPYHCETSFNSSNSRVRRGSREC